VRAVDEKLGSRTPYTVPTRSYPFKALSLPFVFLTHAYPVVHQDEGQQRAAAGALQETVTSNTSDQLLLERPRRGPATATRTATRANQRLARGSRLPLDSSSVRPHQSHDSLLRRRHDGVGNWEGRSSPPHHNSKARIRWRWLQHGGASDSNMVASSGSTETPTRWPSLTRRRLQHGRAGIWARWV
jgi:hypothetical protein